MILVNLFWVGMNPTLFMPPWEVCDIPLFEGTWLFRNRGVGLVQDHLSLRSFRLRPLIKELGNKFPNMGKNYPKAEG